MMGRAALLLSLVLLVISLPAHAVHPWYDANWDRRVMVTANSGLIPAGETFTDFALLVILDGARNPDVFANAKADGSDLVFTAVDGQTEFSREVVSYDPVAGTAEIWVRVPAFASTLNNLYLYYSNPAANLPADPAGAWGSEYRLVYHFEDDPGDQFLSDASTQAAHASMNPGAGWTSGDVESGQIGQGWLFNGTTHHVNSSLISTQSESYSISAWLKPYGNDSDFMIETSSPDFWHLSIGAPDGAAQPTFYPDYTVSGTQVTWNPATTGDGAYHHFLWAFDAEAGTVDFYLDGVAQSVKSVYDVDGGDRYDPRTINPAKSVPVGILGNQWYSLEEYDRFAGGADEYRIREGVPSASRVLAEYRSQDDNFAFLSFGPTETYGAGHVVGIADGSGTRISLSAHPNPSSGHTVFRFALAEPGRVRLAVYDLAGRRVATVVDREFGAGTWTERWSGRDDRGKELAAGLYFGRLTTSGGESVEKVTLVR